ncbi:MAG: formylmethanofuran dehydrogenase subunit A [Planctomycetaceae bacterium]
MSLLHLKNGIIHDPVHGVDGVVGDLWIENGRLVTDPKDSQRRPTRVIDLTGMVVMPGGVDMHCHIVGPKVNSARKMQPEMSRNAPPMPRTPITRSGSQGNVPSSHATGYLYAGLGYTTAFDAAISPLGARASHEELQDTPIIDKGFYLLMGNHHYLMQQAASGEYERLKACVAWLLQSTGGYACKIVNAGGVEVWKTTGGDAKSIDSPVAGFDVSPRTILQQITRAVDDLKLPHAAHIHCNNLGMPGNWSTTLDTMRALSGNRGHLTHIQFHSYGGNPDDQPTMHSRVPELVDYVYAHPELSVDVGQVLFGDTTSMTGDGPLGHFLHQIYGRKWLSVDAEMEGGCGIVPVTYRDKSFVHALQWAIGLEWYLLMPDPWRIAMSTDHPNGGSFLAYPQIIAMLMDRGLRHDTLQRLPAGVLSKCTLGEITREYTLQEIAIITRAAPARMLGLKQKGHLGVGADADITVYQPNADKQQMFELPRYVIHAGEVVVDDAQLQPHHDGPVHYTAPSFDCDVLPHIRDWFEANYTLQFRNYPIDASLLAENGVCSTLE